MKGARPRGDSDALTTRHVAGERRGAEYEHAPIRRGPPLPGRVIVSEASSKRLIPRYAAALAWLRTLSGVVNVAAIQRWRRVSRELVSTYTPRCAGAPSTVSKPMVDHTPGVSGGRELPCGDHVVLLRGESPYVSVHFTTP